MKTWKQMFDENDWKGIKERIVSDGYEDHVIVWTNLLPTNQKTAEKHGNNNLAITRAVEKNWDEGKYYPHCGNLYHISLPDMDIIRFINKSFILVIFKEDADATNGYIQP